MEIEPVYYYLLPVTVAIIAFLFFRMQIYDFWFSSLKTSSMNEGSRHITSVVFSTLTLPVMLFCVVSAFYNISSTFSNVTGMLPDKKFSATEWRRRPRQRYEIARDLEHSEILIGKTRYQAEKLLGRGYTMKNPEIVFYNTGFERKPGIFDKQPKMTHFIVRVGNDTIYSAYYFGEGDISFGNTMFEPAEPDSASEQN
ncbi:MAG: hypothetical protein V4543_11705 [Bacteroidota bacterium]